MPTGLLTMLRSYRHIRPHNEQRERIEFYLWSKGQPLVLSWNETIFAKKRGGADCFLFSLLFLFLSQTLSTHPSLLSLLRVSQATTTHQTLGACRPYPIPLCPILVCVGWCYPPHAHPLRAEFVVFSCPSGTARQRVPESSGLLCCARLRQGPPKSPHWIGKWKKGSMHTRLLKQVKTVKRVTGLFIFPAVRVRDSWTRDFVPTYYVLQSSNKFELETSLSLKQTFQAMNRRNVHPSTTFVHPLRFGCLLSTLLAGR